MKIYTLILAFLASIFLAACGGSNNELSGTDVVESGTYTGTAVEVDPDEQEIYVETADGKTLELYFTEQTTVTLNGQSADFSALTEGGQVEVEVEKKGQRLEPIAVTILNGNG